MVHVSAPRKIHLFSVIPSPYQRDFFQAIEARPSIELKVSYLEEAAPDSPWDNASLEPWEQILPGRKLTLGNGRVRCHLHWPLPESPEADLVILNTPITAGTTQWLARRISVPFLFWGERFIERKIGPRGGIQKILRSGLGHAAGFLGVGKQAREQYQRFFPEHPVWSLPYHPNLERFRTARAQTRSDDSGRKVSFLFAGQRIKRKGFDGFLRAFARLHSEHPEVRAIIAGRATTESENCLRRLPASTRAAIDDCGFVQPVDLPRTFAAADAFVLPSRHDGWGVVVNEALATGVPVLASDQVGAAIDLVRDGVEGMIHREGDEQMLFEHMKQLLDPERRSVMSEAAEKRAEIVEPDRGAATLDQIVTEVLATTA